MSEKISVITPFYKGNIYMKRLMESLTLLYNKINGLGYELEAVLVNDSPEVEIIIEGEYPFEIVIINNEVNSGIQKSRINGYRRASGDYIVFLDQDDELDASAFPAMLEKIRNADLVVANALYQHGEEKYPLYKSYAQMKYYIRFMMFVRIRNLIASPGHCLIRYSSLPEEWTENPMKINGADDWLLWLIMFSRGSRIELCPDVSYIHNNSLDGTNLSFDLKKMYDSSMEMHSVLESRKILSPKHLNTLKRAIEFKYRKDTGKASPADYIKFFEIVLYNVIYKIKSRVL